MEFTAANGPEWNDSVISGLKYLRAGAQGPSSLSLPWQPRRLHVLAGSAGRWGAPLPWIPESPCEAESLANPQWRGTMSEN